MCDFSHDTAADGHRVKDQLRDAIEQKLVGTAASDAGARMFSQTTTPDDGVEMHLQVNAPDAGVEMHLQVNAPVHDPALK